MGESDFAQQDRQASQASKAAYTSPADKYILLILAVSVAVSAFDTAHHKSLKNSSFGDDWFDEYTIVYLAFFIVWYGVFFFFGAVSIKTLANVVRYGKDGLKCYCHEFDDSPEDYMIGGHYREFHEDGSKRADWFWWFGELVIYSLYTWCIGYIHR